MTDTTTQPDTHEANVDAKLQSKAEEIRRQRDAKRDREPTSAQFDDLLRRISSQHVSPVDDDQRFVIEQRRDAARVREQEEARRAAAVQALAVPPLYAGASLDTTDEHSPELAAIVRKARAYVQAWPTRRDLARAFPQIVLMLGVPGAGKGHIAWAIARAIAEQHGDTARILTLSEIVRDLRASWGRGDASESERAALTRYRALELLVIDEVSKHALYGEPAQHLYDLIAHREMYLRPTILTSNEDTRGLGDLLGHALVSRAMGWSTSWQFPAVDYRARRRQARGAA